MSLTNNINSLIRTKKVKKTLGSLPVKKTIESVRAGDASTADDRDFSGPLALEITLETVEEMQARPDGGKIYQNGDNTSSNWVEVKLAKTAKMTDGNGKEFEFNQIKFIEP